MVQVYRDGLLDLVARQGLYDEFQGVNPEQLLGVAFHPRDIENGDGVHVVGLAYAQPRLQTVHLVLGEGDVQENQIVARA